ncbi:MAG: PIG-L family deacetylase [Candidatus Competibacteraceae bacterium]
MSDALVHCFFSPHPDDIAFSAMGSLLQIPNSVQKILVTVFSQSCWTFLKAPQVDQWQEVTALRAKEDQQFADRFGFGYVNLSLSDSSLRYSHGQEYMIIPTDDPVFQEAMNHAEQLMAQLPDDTFYYIPLGIGGHVDHLIVRTMITKLCSNIDRLQFYEDLPYAYHHSDTEIKAIAKSIDNHLEAQLIDMEKFWSEKTRSIHIYSSQLEPHTYQRIEAYASRIGTNGRKAERFWSVGNVK